MTTTLYHRGAFSGDVHHAADRSGDVIDCFVFQAINTVLIINTGVCIPVDGSTDRGKGASPFERGLYI